MGRPPIPYDPNRHPEWVRGLASRGSSVKEICAAMGISSVTLYAWRDKYPDFAAALQVGRNETIARLYNAIRKKAEGFSEPVEDKHVKQKGVYVTDKETGEKKFVIMSEEREATKKVIHYPPDPKAAALMLVNLDPTFRTERTAMELTGKDGAPLAVEKTVIILPDNGRGPPPKVIPAEYRDVTTKERVKES
jgi:transposase-like protein